MFAPLRFAGSKALAACVGAAFVACIAPAAPRDDSSPFPPDVPALEIPRDGAENPGPLPELVSAQRSPRDPARWSTTFKVIPRDRAKSLNLAGSFNGWNASVTPMKLEGVIDSDAPRADGGSGDQVWSVTLDLPDGEHWYKFVADGSRWFADPANPDGADDGHGGRNSRIRLGAEANLDASGAAIGDGRVDPIGVAHDPRRRREVERLPDGGTRVRVRTLAHDVESVELASKNHAPRAMTLTARGGTFDWWEATLPASKASTSGRKAAAPTAEAPGAVDAPRLSPEPIQYTFVFKDGDRRVRDPKIYTLDADRTPALVTPDWARDAVWYQIMIDRFANGDPANDPDPVRPWRSEWYAPSAWEGRDGQTFYKHFVFDRLYGGDLKGLRDRLPYLRDLGVNALYLMPIFQAQGSHKYNGTNYLHVDEHFGTKGDYAPAEAKEDLLDPKTWTWTASDRAFLDFLREAKAMGFRVIVDGVFNHTGTEHPAFKNVRDRRQKSRFADWYDIRSWEPFDYDGWWGYKALPVFRKDPEHGLASRSLREHIFAVTRRWMDPNGDGDPSDGIDGWRLDVPNEVPIAFWREWRALVKSINPNAYVTGEIWTRADEWLDGTAFDAVMNYEFAKPALAWVGNREKKLKASEMDARLAELRLAYPAAAIPVLQNLLDSHDTDRVGSMLRNPDRPYNERNREQEGHLYDSSRPGPEQYRRQRLLVLLQMIAEGAPMVYYGDEVGMWGAGDPGNRKPMLWKDLEPYDDPKENFVDAQMLDYYRRAIALRRAHSALRRGSFVTLAVDDEQDCWLILREDAHEQVLVALNASDRAAVLSVPAALGTGWRAVFGEAEGPPGDPEWPRVEIPPAAGRVWMRAK